MPDKVILLLVSVVLMTAVIIFNLIFSPKNCWDQYTTEQEAISKCETRP
jgi:hypothetical protein